ncbi:MAG: phosphopantothenoylcysteine decarboxylase [Candidatus Aminicenantes bacterium]|nr:phosphopantothenoylcysteine decarboxylase [Candidatus Aminicenantes bacterium]
MKILLGISGSISSYKAADILRFFQKNSHGVSVIMTENAKKFISPLTFETFIPGQVYDRQFSDHQDPLLHINICNNHDLFLIAPATANVIGKIANGIADDLLSTVFLAFDKKVVIAPAMNTRMYENPAVKDNLSILRSRGVEVIEPEDGSLACTKEGKGRLAEVEKIYNFCLGILNV